MEKQKTKNLFLMKTWEISSVREEGNLRSRSMNPNKTRGMEQSPQKTFHFFLSFQ